MPFDIAWACKLFLLDFNQLRSDGETQDILQQQHSPVDQITHLQMSHSKQFLSKDNRKGYIKILLKSEQSLSLKRVAPKA